MIGNLVALRDGSGGLTKSTLHATLKLSYFNSDQNLSLDKFTRAGVLEGEVLVLELVAVD